MPKRTLYFSERMYERLDISESGPEGLSGRVSNLCDIAIETMRDAVPVLSSAEWYALIDIANGYFRDASRSLAEQAFRFRLGVSQSGPERNKKWDVNCVALARKLDEMALIEQCAVMEVCRRFWVRNDINRKYETHREMLEAHGARFSD